jgi:hypothetical protein
MIQTGKEYMQNQSIQASVNKALVGRTDPFIGTA